MGNIKNVYTKTERRSAGLKTKSKLISEHGSDYYARIGRKGGSKTDTRPKGFEANPALARIAGAKGGRKSGRKSKSA